MVTWLTDATESPISLEELEIRKVDSFRWVIPRQGCMRVEGLLYADEALMRETLRPGQGSFFPISVP